MKQSRPKCTRGSKQKLTHTRSVPLITFTPDEVDLLLSVIDLLALIGNDSRTGATKPLVREINQRTGQTRQKLVLIKDQLGEMVTFDHTDYVLLYTAVIIFDQVKRLMPVLLPPSLAGPHVEARVQALEKMFSNTLPSVRVDEVKRG